MMEEFTIHFEVNEQFRSDLGAVKWTLKYVRPKVRSSWCAAKESYSGLENRICLKGRGGVVVGRFVRRVQALSSSCFYLLDTKLCPTLSPFTQGYKWILIRSRGGGGGGGGG